MTLFDCECGSDGYLVGIGGDGHTHRRLVDMGLVGARYHVRAKRKRSLLVDFDDGFSAVIERVLATVMEVIESSEDSALRQSERR